MRVVRDPRLQAAERGFAPLAAAIEKLAVDAADFRDVRVIGDASAVGQDETDGFVSHGGEQGGEFGGVHKLSGFVSGIAGR